jgi:hypothetical protein
MGDFPFLANRGLWQPNLSEWKFLAHALSAIGEARYGQSWGGDELSLFRLNPSLAAKYPKAQLRCREIFGLVTGAIVNGGLRIGLMPQQDDIGPTLLPAEPEPLDSEQLDFTITQWDRLFNYCRVNPEQPSAGKRWQDFESPTFKWIYIHVEGLERLIGTLQGEPAETTGDKNTMRNPRPDEIGDGLLPRQLRREKDAKPDLVKPKPEAKRVRRPDEQKDDKRRNQLHKINQVAKSLGAHFPLGKREARSLANRIVANSLVEYSFETVRKIITGRSSSAKRLAREGQIEPFWDGSAGSNKPTPAKSARVHSR